MALKLARALATPLKTPEYAQIAEDLGYERARCYDSPPKNEGVRC